jgi:putative PIN family toxin of toxin-antitoxin system
MILIVDANILFSALIKNSLTTELIFNETLKLYTCEYIVDEFFKYENEILKKTHRSKNEFIEIMHQLKSVITIIPKKEYSNYFKKAKSISPDPNDFIYFALALKMKASIWSNDKQLKKQNIINIYLTNELLNLI